MPWKKMEIREQRVEFVVRALRGTVPLSQLCREFDISRPTGYLWMARYREGGVVAIEERSRRPEHSPTRTTPELEACIRALRQAYPDWGASSRTNSGRWTSRDRRTGPSPVRPCR
jgi:transposase-like protein